MKKLLTLLAVPVLMVLPLLVVGCSQSDTKMSATDRQDNYRQVSDESRTAYAYDVVPE